MKTVLFVGAGRHQRRAILQAREQGIRVVAVDGNANALGLQVADVPEHEDDPGGGVLDGAPDVRVIGARRTPELVEAGDARAEV